MIKIGIIGFGNIGKKRFKALLKISKFKTKVIYVVDKIKPKKLPKEINFYKNWKDILSIKVDLILLATPTTQTKIIANHLCDKFNILVEKPLSNFHSEIKKITSKSIKNHKILKVGYNLRFDDGLIKTKELLKKKIIGKIYYIKITYANGAARTNTNKV